MRDRVKIFLIFFLILPHTDSHTTGPDKSTGKKFEATKNPETDSEFIVNSRNSELAKKIVNF